MGFNKDTLTWCVGIAVGALVLYMMLPCKDVGM